MHNVDMHVTEFVPGTNAILDENGSVNGSAKDSPPSYSSDGESEGPGRQERALLSAGEIETSVD